MQLDSDDWQRSGTTVFRLQDGPRFRRENAMTIQVTAGSGHTEADAQKLADLIARLLRAHTDN